MQVKNTVTKITAKQQLQAFHSFYNCWKIILVLFSSDGTRRFRESSILCFLGSLLGCQAFTRNMVNYDHHNI